MDKVLLYISTERQNVVIKKELQKAVETVRNEKEKHSSPHLVRLASSVVVGREESVTSAHDGQTLTLWHDISKDDPLEELKSNCMENDCQDSDLNGENNFRYNDFFLLAEDLHKFADELQDIASYLLYIFWCVDKYAPNPSEVPEFFGALKRFTQWHNGGLYIICQNSEIINEWSDFLSLNISQESTPIVKEVIDCLWRGHLTFSVGTSGESVHLPESVITCTSGQPVLGSDPSQGALYILPTAEVVADFDVGTLPWIYLRLDSAYTLTPAQHSDPEEIDEVVAMINELTAQSGMATLVRLRYSSVAPVLEGVKSLTTAEWKRINVEGHFDLVPKLHFKGFHLVLNMIILSEGASSGKAYMIALQDPNSCGEDVVKLYTNARLTAPEIAEEDEKRQLQLLKETPSLTSLHSVVLSHLSRNLPKEFQRRLTRAQLDKKFDDTTKGALEAAASEELLRCLLLIPAPPRPLSEEFCDILPETAASFNSWPQFLALLESEAETHKQNQRPSGDLLGGLAPPPPSEDVLTLEASQLIKLFTKSGQPVDRIKKQMTRHTSSGQSFVKAKSTLKDIQSLRWPESLYSHHHGIYYNVDERHERLMDECVHIKNRYISQETASTCSSFQDKECAFVTVSTNKTNSSKETHAHGKPTSGADQLKIGRKHSSRYSDDTMSMRSGQSSKCNKGPLRRSPRKHYVQREAGYSRSPQKNNDKDTRERRSSKSLMKPSDLLQPTRSRGPLRSSNTQNKAAPKPADLSDLHKQKLRVAVVGSLEKEGMKMKNPLFKVCFKKLFAVCRPFALDVIGQGSTSKTMEKIAKSHVKQVIEFERLKPKRR